YQKDAVRIDATDKSRQHADIEYRAYRIAPNEIEHAVVNTLRWYEAPRAMVFCSTRDSVRHLQASLLERGFSTVSLSGEMGQRERTDALQALRDGRARVCVATDVAARGLDLPDLGLVIHAELPMNRAGLLHRSGRTGRAGKKGVSVMLVPHSRRRKAERLMDEAGIDAVWSGAPTFDEIRKADEGRLLSPEFFEADVSDEDMIVAKRMIAERTPDEIAAALVRLLRKEQPAPEELSDPGSDRSPVKRERTVRNEDGTAAQPWPGDRLGADDVVWFRLDVGRNKNADPKWLIPLICRIGGISKPQIGAIRTFPEETRFEIAKTHEKAFREAVAASNDEVKITASEAPTPGSMKAGKFAGAGKPRREDGDRPFKKTPYKRADGGEGDARPPFKKKPWAPKADAGGENPRSNAAGDKPFAKKPFKAKPGFKKAGFKPKA
ncbi:MAG: DbpA RNA binding domain-containing protein, partial [Alphaproteobacteria bacterium]|nr:DbpA RNA binding domain-containing protein [Alphaproteobacteria bacterium]